MLSVGPGPGRGVLACLGKDEEQPLNSIPGQLQNCGAVAPQTNGAVAPPFH